MKSARKYASLLVRTVCLGLILSIGNVNAQTDPNSHRSELQGLASQTLKHYFGDETGDYSDPGPIVDQIGEILGGIPNPEVVLPDGKVFYSACRAHSCPEKAAEVVDLSKKRVYAIGLIHFHCRPVGVKDEQGQRHVCDRDPTLTIFVFREKKGSADDVDITAAVERIKEWGQTGGSSYEISYPPVRKIEIVDRFEGQLAGSTK